MSTSDITSPAPLRVTHEDDPKVVAKATTDDYARHVVPLTARTGKWSLANAMWAVLSALFYLYIGASVSQAVGGLNTVIGMVLAVVIYGVVNYLFSKMAIRTGLTVALLSRRIFGGFGGIIATLLFAVTAVYYAVFEGSIIAVALQQFFAPESDLRWWYLAVVLYALPLVIGGVQVWLGKLNGILLPFYLIGLVVIVVATGNGHGYSAEFMTTAAPAAASVPGWLWAVCIYMGVFVNMMFTMDYARFGKPQDTKFHGVISFGFVFYVLLFIMNGLVGMFLMYEVLPDLGATESGVAQAILQVAGGFGLIFIIVSQTRINSANYYLASTNLDAFAGRAFGLRWPRLVWVLVAGILTYLLMLTDVFSYLLLALAWQGVAVTSWVAIVLTYFVLHRHDRHGPEFRPGRVKQVLPGAWAWLASTAIGIAILQLGEPGSWYVLTAPLLTVVLASIFYAVGVRFDTAPVLARKFDPRDEVDSVWDDRIECHVCEMSYTALETDRDPSAGQQAICAGCADGNKAFLEAARQEAADLADSASAPTRRPGAEEGETQPASPLQG